ncbi:right-handed parallel beta-helix repeat-containing protein [Haloarcula sp. CGMCC 1.6347]|uniref:right-handed parallel beta-helix repeat-containing protein n=1 Tax=Haloarcula sp. CGMCC 1.6347 TaxID=3111455 RepID=UPI00300F77B8
MVEKNYILPHSYDGASSSADSAKEGRLLLTRRQLLGGILAASTVPMIPKGLGMPSSRTLEIISTDQQSETGSLDVRYEFTTTGEIVPVNDGENAAEANDSVAKNDDETWTAIGWTGNGFGDSYEINGIVTDFNASGNYEIRLDGAVVTVSELVAPADHVVEIQTTEDPSELDYELTTTGEPIPCTGDTENAADDNDRIVRNDDDTWMIDGYTGNGYGDQYYFSGEIIDFGPVEPFASVYVDGKQIDLSPFERSPDPATEIGGGGRYTNTVPESDANYVVETLSELLTALDAAGRGDIVYVAGDATIDASPVTGSDRLTVPAGVTLASNRGIDGASGGQISTGVIDYEHLMGLSEDVRLTGLQIRGPETGYREYSTPVSSGVTVERTGCEIDNTELWGFNHAALKLRTSTHIHHCHIHDNPMGGLGYGIQCLDGDNTLIEYNRFDFNRHSVASGTGKAGYEVRYNHFGGTETPSYQVGTHQPGGTTLLIHHNTFTPLRHVGRHPGEPGTHVSIRGVPEDRGEIHHNWFYNPKQPSAGRGNEAVIQPHVESLTNLRFGNNHYGQNIPDGDVGCPRR